MYYDLRQASKKPTKQNCIEVPLLKEPVVEKLLSFNWTVLEFIKLWNSFLSWQNPAFALIVFDNNLFFSSKMIGLMSYLFEEYVKRFCTDN